MIIIIINHLLSEILFGPGGSTGDGIGLHVLKFNPFLKKVINNALLLIIIKKGTYLAANTLKLSSRYSRSVLYAGNL